MKTSKILITRLSQYRNAVERLKSLGFVKVFSENLADAIGINAPQVRKDFSMFGITGAKKGGYRIDNLLEKLNTILGKDKVNDVIVVGAGHIGKALIDYIGFEKQGIRITAAFDNDPQKHDPANHIPILPIEQLTEFVQAHQIRVGVIAVPDSAAQKVCDARTRESHKR